MDPGAVEGPRAGDVGAVSALWVMLEVCLGLSVVGARCSVLGVWCVVGGEKSSILNVLCVFIHYRIEPPDVVVLRTYVPVVICLLCQSSSLDLDSDLHRDSARY